MAKLRLTVKWTTATLADLKKATALVLAAALIAAIPGPAAAQAVGAIVRGVPARSAAVPVAPLTLAAASMPLGAPAVLAVSPAATAVSAAPLLAASAAPAAAAVAPAAAAPRTVWLGRPGAAAAALSANKTAPENAGRDFDGSKDYAAAPADPSVAAVASAPESAPRTPALAKSAPRGPPASRAYAWAAGLVAAPALAAVSIAHSGWAVTALAALSTPCYWLANITGAVFPFFQMYTIFKNRSADVSSMKLTIGLVASLMLAVNFAHMGLAMAAMQNLVGVLAFGVIAGQKYWYARHPAAGAAPLSAPQALARTAASAFVVGGLTVAIGKVMIAALPAVALAGSLLIPFQILAGLGFAALMLPEYLKITTEKSVGDSDDRMAWALLSSDVSNLAWSVNQLLHLTTRPSAGSLLPLAAFTAALTAVSFGLVRWIAARRWAFIPQTLKVGRWTLTRESMVNTASFLVLGAFMLATLAAAMPMFSRLLTIPAAGLADFKTYLFYLLENVISMAVTIEALRAHRAHAAEPASEKR